MRIGIVTDAACDLPPQFLADNSVEILPIRIRAGADTLIDTRDPAATQSFYDRYLGESASGDIESVPYTADEVRDVFLERFVKDYDYVIVVTITRSRSPIYDNATKASFGILSAYKSVREAAGVTGPFALRVIDSQNIFTGQAMVVAEAVRLIAEGVAPSRVIQHLDEFAVVNQAYLVPEGLAQIRRRGKARGDSSVGLASFVLGSALDIKPIARGYKGDTGPVAKMRGFDNAVSAVVGAARQALTEGLESPYIVASFGGPPAKLDALPGMAELEAAAKAKGVTVLKSLMSMTTAANVGAGAFSLAWAAKKLATFG